MVLSVFTFTLMDSCVKALVPRIGVLPTLWARYAGQMMLVLILVAPRLKTVVRTKYPVAQFFRSLLLMCTTAFFFTGLSRIALTDAVSLMAINPVLITLGAAIFLREALGPRRLIGIGIALCGTMIIIRPGSDVFTLSAFFPLGAACCYTGYVLLTRRVGSNEDVWTSLFYTGALGTIILSIIVPFNWNTPDATALVLIAMLSIFGTAGQLFLIRAFSLGEAAMLAPYVYFSLVFAAIWGFLFFAEIPDLWTVAGALVIAGAGLYVWHRETSRP